MTMLTLGLAFIAGLLTLLNPCVLPLLPLVLSGAMARGRLGPLALTAGLVLSFTGLGVLIAAFGSAAGISGGLLRQIAAVLLILSGLLLYSSRAQAVFATLAQPLAGGADALGRRFDLGGNRGQFVIGLLLGAVWTPCVGPTLGAAIALAASGEHLFDVTLTMLAFSLGVASFFLMVGYGSRGLLARNRERFAMIGSHGRRWFGMLMLLVGLMILSGTDKALEAALLSIMPDWLITLTTRF